MPRRRSKVVSTRASTGEAALIHAAALAEGASVNEWALPRLLEAARHRLVFASCVQSPYLAVRAIREDTWPFGARCAACAGGLDRGDGGSTP